MVFVQDRIYQEEWSEECLEYILTKLFDTEKTETYDERFNTERRKRKGKRALEDC